MFYILNYNEIQFGPFIVSCWLIVDVFGLGLDRYAAFFFKKEKIFKEFVSGVRREVGGGARVFFFHSQDFGLKYRFDYWIRAIILLLPYYFYL